MNENNEILNGDEVDLRELIKVIWSKRGFIFKVTSIFMVLGVLIAFTSKVEFEASCTLLPESQKGMPELGGLGGLAGLAGFDLSGFGGEGALSPELYPQIVNSVPFLNKLINSPVYFENLDTILTPFEYFKEVDRPSMFGYLGEYTIGLPSKIKKLLSSSEETSLPNYDMVRFSKVDWEVMEGFSERLSVSADTKTGTITIHSKMSDPVAAAQVTSQLVEELSKRIISYKANKAITNLDFIKERFEEARTDYESRQERLARFTDQNRNMTTSIVQTEYERLQNEMTIAFELYKGLATQLEQAKIKVKDETPIFTILEPVKVPIEKSEPRRIVIIVLSLILGVISSLLILFMKILISSSAKSV